VQRWLSPPQSCVGFKIRDTVAGRGCGRQPARDRRLHYALVPAIATIARLATTIAMMEMIDILLITLRSISNQFHCSLMRAIVSCLHFAPRAAKAIHEITRTK
jgi:hypothetical protein